MSQVAVDKTKIENIATAEIELIERLRKEMREAAIQEEMKPRWYRRKGRTHEAAERIIEKRENSAGIMGPSWLWIWSPDKMLANQLLKACKMTDESFILLTIDEAATLRRWENELKNA